jgi:O-antigen ligase
MVDSNPKKKTLLFSSILVYSLCLRNVNYNVGRRWPEFEVAFPNLNIVDIVISCLLVYALIALSSGTRIRVPRTIEGVIFFLLVCFCMVSFYFITASQELGFDRLITVVEMYAVYLFVYNLCQSEDDIAFVIKLLMFTIVFETIIVASELILGYNFFFSLIAGDIVKDIGEGGIVAERRIAGSMGDAVMFGWIMTFLFLIILPFAAIPNSKIQLPRKKLIWSAVAVIGFGALTMTRTALVGELVIAPFGIYVLARKYNRSMMRWIMKLCFLVAVLVGLIFLIPGAADILSKRTSDAEEVTSSWELRLNSFNVGLRILEDFPLTGLGIGMGSLWAYKSEVLENYIEDMDEETQISYAGIHSGHAIVFAEMGMLGYGLYIGFLLLFLRRSFTFLSSRVRTTAQIGAVGIMAILFLIFSDFMGVSISIKHGMLYLSLILGMVSSAVHFRT